MNEDTNLFLTEGLKAYADARDTLAFFEKELISVLAAATERREKWLPLKNHSIKSITADKGQGQLGYWVAVEVEGQSQQNEQVKIDCGIWWKALGKDDSPIIYASFTDYPKRLLKFNWSQNKQGIRSFERWNRTFLYIPASDPADIGKSLNRLLDELLKQLA